ncbi:MAG TPA: cytidine deaminase [Sandaracinaceae bacterium LLY-WYZ-13_1]|nr:cytidine deaminase [Sandaracinaceae bacterium LLY-WYZ-13_1]
MSAGPEVTDEEWETLERAAREVREHAHAPYSGYRVGAALLDAHGGVHRGCNVENASYGLCLCAERGAVARAVAEGARRFRALVVVTGGARAAAPCGMCRQVLAEMPPSFPIRCVSLDGDRFDTSVSELLPHAFDAGYLDE